METSYSLGYGKRALGTTLAAIGLVGASWVGFSTEALAEHRGHRKVAHHRRIVADGRRVVVPRAIYGRDRAFYARFQSGRAYYAPHRHYHVRYSFPVYVNGAVRYRPYSYCGDHVFLTGAVALPRLAIGFEVGPVRGQYYRDPGYEVYSDADGYYGYDGDHDDYGYDDYRYRYDHDSEEDSDSDCD